MRNLCHSSWFTDQDFDQEPCDLLKCFAAESILRIYLHFRKSENIFSRKHVKCCHFTLFFYNNDYETNSINQSSKNEL
jgi:hypothetical protein